MVDLDKVRGTASYNIFIIMNFNVGFGGGDGKIKIDFLPSVNITKAGGVNLILPINQIENTIHLLIQLQKS